MTTFFPCGPLRGGLLRRRTVHGGTPGDTGPSPGVLSRHTGPGGILSLEEAVRRMTGLPASILGLDDPGRVDSPGGGRKRIRQGFAAGPGPLRSRQPGGPGPTSIPPHHGAGMDMVWVRRSRSGRRGLRPGGRIRSVSSGRGGGGGCGGGQGPMKAPGVILSLEAFGVEPPWAPTGFPLNGKTTEGNSPNQYPKPLRSCGAWTFLHLGGHLPPPGGMDRHPVPLGRLRNRAPDRSLVRPGVAPERLLGPGVAL